MAAVAVAPGEVSNTTTTLVAIAAATPVILVARVAGAARVAAAVCLDSTDESALRASGMAEAATVVLALGENQLEQAVLTTMLLREIGVGRIISRAASDVQRKVLERIGVSKVVFPERQVGEQIARQVMMPAVQRFVPLGDGLALRQRVGTRV